ncbi:MAG: flagellar basal body rod protein FlgC [Pseudomonadota bacterium]
MSRLNDAMTASASGLSAQSARLRLTAENIANVDTPGYRAKGVSFEVMAGDIGGVRLGNVDMSSAAPTRVHNPAHPLAGPDGYYDGSNVNVMIEMADAQEAQRSYDANLRLFDQARQMSSSLMDLLRR